MQISAEQLIDLLHDAKQNGWAEGYKIGFEDARDQFSSITEPLGASENIADDPFVDPNYWDVSRSSSGDGDPL